MMPRDPAGIAALHTRSSRTATTCWRCSDVRHAGGNEYRYRLRVGSFPLVTAVYPAGGRSGAVMSFELTGHEADRLGDAECRTARHTQRTAACFFQRAAADERGLRLVPGRSQSGK